MKKKGILKQIYKKRDLESRKYDFGHLLVIGGSEKYSGSPTFNSLAAYRSGVDIVTTAVPEDISGTVASFSPSIITRSLSKSYLKSSDITDLEKLAEKADAVVIGGGLGRKEETKKCVQELLRYLEIPAVIDADAIHAVSEEKSTLSKNQILTPHEREYKVLTGEKPPKNLKKRKKSVEQNARELNCSIILKGNIDIVTNGEETLENNTGSPYMTKGGTGDILAGIAGAMLVRGFNTIKSGYASTYINGKAGELASKEKGEGMLPEETLEKIPEVIKEIKG